MVHPSLTWDDRLPKYAIELRKLLLGELSAAYTCAAVSWVLLATDDSDATLRRACPGLVPWACSFRSTEAERFIDFMALCAIIWRNAWSWLAEGRVKAGSTAETMLLCRSSAATPSCTHQAHHGLQFCWRHGTDIAMGLNKTHFSRKYGSRSGSQTSLCLLVICLEFCHRVQTIECSYCESNHLAFVVTASADTPRGVFQVGVAFGL